MPRRLPLTRRTVICALPVRPVCTASRNWRFTQTTSFFLLQKIMAFLTFSLRIRSRNTSRLPRLFQNKIRNSVMTDIIGILRIEKSVAKCSIRSTKTRPYQLRSKTVNSFCSLNHRQIRRHPPGSAQMESRCSPAASDVHPVFRHDYGILTRIQPRPESKTVKQPGGMRKRSPAVFRQKRQTTL